MASNGESTNKGTIESRRSKHTTKFDRVTSDAKPRLFGKRPHLAKEGREIANAASELIQKEEPNWVSDPDDPTLAEVLKYAEAAANNDPLEPKRIREHETATLCDLLMEGLSFNEAVTFYLYEHAGLTLREIYHVDEGKERSFSREQDRQAERNVASTIQRAAEKLGVDVDIAIQ